LRQDRKSFWLDKLIGRHRPEIHYFLSLGLSARIRQFNKTIHDSKKRRAWGSALPNAASVGMGRTLRWAVAERVSFCESSTSSRHFALGVKRPFRGFALTEVAERLLSQLPPAPQGLEEAIESMNVFRDRPGGTQRHDL
jgi:hypothetical protein